MLWDSRTRVVVTGLALRSCLGNLSETWQSLLLGKTGLRIQQPFITLSPYPLGLISATPLTLSNLLFPVLQEALKCASLVPPLLDCGVVVGSSRACQGEWENIAKQGNIENWLEMLPHQAATLTARYIKTCAPVLAPMNACSTGIWSIFRAYELIRSGQCQQVITGAIDTPITPLTLTGFQQIGALAPNGCYPFDQHRQGLVLAEGAAVLVLESLESAQSRDVPYYGEIKGFGVNCDAYHATTPELSGRQAIKAIKNCLERGGLAAEDIDLIYAHGTATVLNDQREAAIIEAVNKKSAVAAVKGAIGHTLGASGAISAILALKSLEKQIIPPCVGLQSPAFSINLQPRAVSGRVKQVLCLSFGFGGQNAVLALGV